MDVQRWKVFFEKLSKLLLIWAVLLTGAWASSTLTLHIPPGWKLYAPAHPEDTLSYPPNFSWQGEIFEMSWPVPHRIIEEGRHLSVYENTVSLSIRKPFNSAEKHLRGTLTGLMCAQQCRPFSLQFSLPPSIHRHLTLPLHTSTPPEALSLPVSSPTSSLLWSLILALGGGFILNGMPCVFPLLALKAMALQQLSQGSIKASVSMIQRYCGTTALGILCGIWLIAALLTLLKIMGHTLSWGFYFQSPVALGILGFVCCALGAAVLIGKSAFLWIPGILQTRFNQWAHKHGAFGTGLVTVLLATPCTAPLMAPALAMALNSNSWVQLWLILTALGIGFALPQGILALMGPLVANWLPKSGLWLRYIEKFSGLSLAAMGVYLLNISIHSTPLGLKEPWKPFSLETVQQALKEQKVVVVNITASWCLTCHVNDYRVWNHPQVTQYLKKPHIVALQGDWTHHDPHLTAFMTRHNRAGIPFSLVLSAKGPQVLSSLMSTSEILRALKEAQ